MRLLQYLPNSVVDGVGIRQVFFLAGCPHHCLQCHNPQSWNPNGGTYHTVDEIVKMALDNPFDVTFSGGDPLFQIDELLQVLKEIKPHRSIWVYTGYTWDEINANPRLKRILAYIDVLVDGRFEVDKRDTHLQFRGSSNQRLIDVQASLKKGEIVLWVSGISFVR